MDEHALVAPRGDMSHDVGELAKALAVAQGKIRAAEKDRANPFFNSTYATLASVWEACREPLSGNGLSVVQQPVNDGERVGVVTTLFHGSGQWMRSTLWAKPKDGTPQSLGSAITYLRRYALAAAVGVAPDDDDGNEAQRGADPKAGKAPPAPRANTVKHTGAKASSDAVKMLHVLQGKVGGLSVCDPKSPCPYKNGSRCDYHKQLAAFKDSEGNPVTTSKDLSPEQIANLIGRYEKRISEQELRAAQDPDLGAVIPANGNARHESTTAIANALKSKEMDSAELCAIFGVDDVSELTGEAGAQALTLVLAHGTPSYGRILAEVTGVPQ